MAAPVAGAAARIAVNVASNSTFRRGALALVLGIFMIPALVLIGVLGYFAEADCAPATDADFGGTWDGPGSLGGVMGTGVSSAELRMARSHPFGGAAIVPSASYVSTAYAPARAGINCGAGCDTTASGIRVNSGTRRLYGIASNPTMNKYGALAYIWPNPYGWKGPFVVMDTGGNFDGSDGSHRIDFYVWGKGDRALRWGRKGSIRVSAAPIVAGGPTDTTAIDNAPEAGVDACDAGASPSWGTADGGRLTIAPGANRAGVDLNPAFVSFARQMAARVGPQALVITTGTNHSRFTTTGNVSDHWTGWAADFGMSANGFAYGCTNCRGQRIAAAALNVAGMPERAALSAANRGGAWTQCSKGIRVQTIYRSNTGGDHFNHIHVGLRRGC